MNFFKKIKGLFSKSKKEEVIPSTDCAGMTEPIIREQEEKSLNKCDICKEPILPGERWSKFQGNYYHKPCFKMLKKQAFSGY